MKIDNLIETVMRRELLRNIRDRYNVSLKMSDEIFVHGDKEVSLIREIPGEYPSTVSIADLKGMPNNIFRKTIADCLSIIPNGLQDFRKLAEEYPHIF